MPDFDNALIVHQIIQLQAAVHPKSVHRRLFGAQLRLGLPQFLLRLLQFRSYLPGHRRGDDGLIGHRVWEIVDWAISNRS